MRTRAISGLLAAATALALAGCAPAAGEGSSLIQIVASTDVYGSIASAIGGDRVEVTSVISDPSQDPHSFEANARIRLALGRADLVIENGGGYDDFMTQLLRAGSDTTATVLDAVELSGLGGGNEHVWYDFGAMRKLGEAIADALSDRDPAAASAYRANAAEFTGGLSSLEDRVAAAKAEHGGAGVAITEPVPLYLLEAMGLVNKTPDEFSEAIEEGTDASPAALNETLELFRSDAVALLVYNEQTTGPETQRVLDAAKAGGTPVVPVSETLPAGEDYLEWMSSNIDAIVAALS